MEIIGRIEERSSMDELLQRSGSEFLAVFGRRRVGKTFLVRNHFKQHIVFDCTGLNKQGLAAQLDNFMNSLSESFPAFKVRQAPASWFQAFHLLEEAIGKIRHKRKKVIFLDELPWFETPKSGFKAALDNFWNAWCNRRDDIVLVICGSAASWIIKHIINDRGGLHNRVTRRIYLEPFTLAETKLYLESRNVHLQPYDLLQLYMMLGGIPFYLNEIRPGRSLAQNIDRLFFQARPVLKHEFDNLYASLFTNYHWHVAVVQALASKDRGLTRDELVAMTGLRSGGGFTTVLNELSESGFISTHYPIKNIRKETIYRLSDEFTLFHFKFLFARRNTSGWLQKAGMQSFKVWCGHAFENFCLKHVGLIKKALGIAGVYTQEASWIARGKGDQEGTQIDLLIDRADNCINICEIKFYNKEFVIDKAYAEKLRRKRAVFEHQTQVRKNVFITMITTYGVVANMYKLGLIQSEVTMKDFFVD